MDSLPTVRRVSIGPVSYDVSPHYDHFASPSILCVNQSGQKPLFPHPQNPQQYSQNYLLFGTILNKDRQFFLSVCLSVYLCVWNPSNSGQTFSTWTYCTLWIQDVPGLTVCILVYGPREQLALCRRAIQL